MAENLIHALQREMNRCRELLKEYEKIPQGQFGAIMIKVDIATAEKSIADGDTVQMIISLKSLQECK
jgi:hypothetical protein